MPILKAHDGQVKPHMLAAQVLNTALDAVSQPIQRLQTQALSILPRGEMSSIFRSSASLGTIGK